MGSWPWTDSWALLIGRHCWQEANLAPRVDRGRTRMPPAGCTGKPSRLGKEAESRNQPLQEVAGRSVSFVILSLTCGSCGLRRQGRSLHSTARGGGASTWGEETGGRGSGLVGPNFPRSFVSVAPDLQGDWISNLLTKKSSGVNF